MVVEAFTDDEKEQIYSMAENITGNCQQGQYRRTIILSNVLRRVQSKKSDNLNQYLQLAISNDDEFAQLVSSFTIHTTDWFREAPHFKKFEALLLERFKDVTKFRMQSGGCSTGEEVFSFALVLEHFRSTNRGFDFDLEAFDIDPVSVQIAKKAIYSLKEFMKVPLKYQQFLTKIEKDDSFTVDQNMKQRTRYYVDNLVKLQKTPEIFHAIVCRNVLIYFTPEIVKKIIQDLTNRLVQGGILILGHSDTIDPKAHNLKSLGNSTFEKL